MLAKDHRMKGKGSFSRDHSCYGDFLIQVFYYIIISIKKEKITTEERYQYTQEAISIFVKNLLGVFLKLNTLFI